LLRTVLFDLDGTLVDTAPDLGAALNEMRARRDLAPLDYALIRPQASHGSQGLLRLGFGVSVDDPQFTALRSEFLDIYSACLIDNSPLFPGVADMLDGLEQRGLSWGIVTNKPARYTDPLVAHLGLDRRAACIVSGDTCARPKPHPEPMHHACLVADCPPSQCLYVGDAERDMQAARAVGMPALVALYGYLAEDDTPEAWGGHGFIETPGALLDYLTRCA
jgi:2-phosphoglycolate phosphatase